MLPKRANVDGCFAKTIINVYDVQTKEVVFAGDWSSCAKFLGVSLGAIGTALKTKGRCKKKYTLRHAPIKTENK